jgi:hypothetical protein
LADWQSRDVGGTLRYLHVSILGGGDVRKYPSGRVPTHPLRDFGANALGKTSGDPLLCKYHGQTAI